MISCELQIEGKDLLRDAGTYLYTSMTHIRNNFRSIKSHNTILFDELEQNNFLDDFLLKNETKIKLLEVTKKSLKLSNSYKKFTHIREFVVIENTIKIIDSANHNFTVNKNQMAMGKELNEKIFIFIF